jgi:DMSO/TMAO reductase YedYZ molybdopterin-dependent catalytic subunit
MGFKSDQVRNYTAFALKIAAMILLAASWVLASDADVLAVRGDVVQQKQWSLAELKKQFADQIITVKFSPGHDAQQSGTGIPLQTLIQAAAPKVEKTPKHHDLAFFVIIQARDSYRAFFSLAELLPQGGNAQAYLIWEVDGKPLIEKESPFRLVVPSDQGHDRQIYAVNVIRLVDGARLASQLEAGH